MNILKQMKNSIYLDNASTTLIDENVLESINKCYINNYGNANSIHSLGRNAKKTINDSKNIFSRLLNCDNEEIFFTSSATLANYYSIDYLLNLVPEKKHIICSEIEHSSIIDYFKYLSKNGYEVSFIKSNIDGTIDLNDLANKLRKDTALVSTIYVNNETGVIQNIKQIYDIVSKNDSFFHTDAVQAVGNLKIDFKALNFDSMTFTAHKIHGPIGISAFLIKKDLIYKLSDSKYYLLNSTPELPLIVGFSEALKIYYNNFNNIEKHKKELYDYFIKKIDTLKGIIEVNFYNEKHINSIINIRILNHKNDLVLAYLDINKICVSAGAACSSGSILPSHTLLSIFKDRKIAEESIRISLSKYNSFKDIDILFESLEKMINPSII